MRVYPPAREAERGGDFLEQLFHCGGLVQIGSCGASGMQSAFFAEGYQFLRKRTCRLGFGQGGTDSLVDDQAADLVGQQGVAVGLRAAEFDGLVLVPHGLLLFGFGLVFLVGRFFRFGLGFDEARFEFQTEAELEFFEFVLDLVERLLAEVAVFEHLGFRLEG